MNYKTNGVFLAKRSYTFKDEKSGEAISHFGYDFLVYDSEEPYGLVKPRVITINVLQSEPIVIADTLRIWDKVNVIVDLFFNSKDGSYKPKYIGVERIKS